MGFRPDIHARIERSARLERRQARQERKDVRRQAKSHPTAPGGFPATLQEENQHVTITHNPPNNDMGWSVDDFRDADGNPPPPADDEDLRGYRMRPEAADAFREWWATQGYTPEILDGLLTEDPVSANAFLDKINRAVRKQRALRYGANG